MPGKTNDYLQHATGTDCKSTFDRIPIEVVEDFVGVAFKRMLVNEKSLLKALPRLIGRRTDLHKEADQAKASIAELNAKIAKLNERSADLEERIQILESEDRLNLARAWALLRFDGAEDETAQKIILSVLREASATDTPEWKTMNPTGNRVLTVRFWGQGRAYQYNLSKNFMKRKRRFIDSHLNSVETNIDDILR